ncbi:MFS transporter [Polycladomyces subterraneus]|uniref:MFS transporter n=1 Tax=Polycladomyces subterraneus TaxID=1016997 RepID=A0ABT8IN17_9BACL|nr:MFS transporter [Polycladomyces subterraneus]MDN4594115.1 MFS transporter [Polycladomyces subterraneus]
MIEVFFDRNFQKLFFANLFSGFGQGMTMIGISWYLVTETGSAKQLGTTMFVSSVLMFLLGPYVGTLIDRFPRKTILLVENAVGLVILLSLALWGFYAPYGQWMLIALFIVTTLIFQIHFPTQSALVQEKFEERHYRSINSLLEIENQTASVLSGGAAGLVLGWYGLPVVLLFDALTYLLAFLLISRMEYVFTLEKHVRENPGTDWLVQFAESWRYIKKKRGFLLFGVSVFMPFIAVMVGNLLSPVFVAQALHADALIYSLHEMTYAIGAVAAGFLISGMTKRLGDVRSLVGNTLVFAAAMIAVVVFPYGWVYVTLTTLFGWCNASVRLVRQNLYMVTVPKHLMGRVLNFFQLVGMMIRLALIGLCTLIIDYTGAGTGYLVLAGLLVLAAWGTNASTRLLMPSSVQPAAAQVKAYHRS